MGYSNERLNEIFDKTNGHCRHCGIQLAFGNYGVYDARGGWHVDHSVPVSKGGSDNLRNLWPLCWKHNLDKKDRHGSYYDKKFEPKTTAGKFVEFLGGRAGDWGTDHHRPPKR